MTRKKFSKKRNSKNSFNRNLIIGVIVVVLLLVLGIKIGGYEITGNVIGDLGCNNDAVCDPGEDMASCPSDCFVFSICNDNGVCDLGEDMTNCPGDCTPTGTCINDGDCTDPSLPYCEDGNCVVCYNDLGGTSIGCDDPFFPACHDATNACVQCSQDSHCAVVALHPICNAEDGNCVQCRSDTDCTDPNYPGCTDYGSCLECTDDSHCNGPDENVCDVTNNVCIGCESDADCPAESPVCDTSISYCEECLTDADCVLQGLNHCNMPTLTANTCEECGDDSHCSGTTPICHGSFTCVGCLNDAECAAAGFSTCESDGSCSMEDSTDTADFSDAFDFLDAGDTAETADEGSLFSELFEETFSWFDSFVGFFASFVVGDEGGEACKDEGGSTENGDPCCDGLIEDDNGFCQLCVGEECGEEMECDPECEEGQTCIAGVCMDDETGTGMCDNNGVCGVNDDVFCGDCDGVCDNRPAPEYDDVAGSPDCNGICEAPSEAWPAPDCDGTCVFGEYGSGDCDGVCGDYDEAAPTGPDCDNICDTPAENPCDLDPPLPSCSPDCQGTSCTDDTECTDPSLPVCAAGGNCVECEFGKTDACSEDQRCDYIDHVCVDEGDQENGDPCNNHDECAAGLICDLGDSNTCIPCNAADNSECPAENPICIIDESDSSNNYCDVVGPDCGTDIWFEDDEGGEGSCCSLDSVGYSDLYGCYTCLTNDDNVPGESCYNTVVLLEECCDLDNYYCGFDLFGDQGCIPSETA